MEEIKLYYDADREREVGSEVEYELVEAGTKSIRKLYIFNDLNFKVNVELSLEGENIQMVQEIKNLIPKQLGIVEFELSPKLTTMKQITAKLNIKIDNLLR